MTKIEGSLLGFRRDIMRMGSMVTDIVLHAVEALSRMDVTASRSVLAEDEAIDSIRFELEERLLHTLALHQPRGGDLREVVAAMRICTDLERIGDYAINAAKSMIKLKDADGGSIHPAVLEMGDVCVDMIEAAMSAYFSGNVDQAREISKLDDNIDARNREVEQYYQKEGASRQSVRICLQNVLMARCFERIGDHVTNICEWILFVKTGIHEELN